MKRMRGALIAAALAGAVLTAGCSDQAPSTAAIVGTTTITEASLTQTTSAVETLIGQSSGAVRMSVLQYTMWGALADQISAAKGITISDADRDDAVTGLQLDELAANQPTRELALDAADFAALASQMSEADFLAEVAKTDVVLNPRYGSWDPTQVTVTGLTGETGSLSKAVTTQG